MTLEMRYAAKVVLERRRRITSIVAAGVFSLFLLTSPSYGQAVPASVVQAPVTAIAQDNSIRPFHFNASDEALADLRQRIAATRWPDRETVTDGVRHTLRAPSVDIGGAVFPVPLPSIVLAEPKCTQAQDRLDTLGGPKLLGALDSFVELFDRRLGFT